VYSVMNYRVLVSDGIGTLELKMHDVWNCSSDVGQGIQWFLNFKITRPTVKSMYKQVSSGVPSRG